MPTQGMTEIVTPALSLPQYVPPKLVSIRDAERSSSSPFPAGAHVRRCRLAAEAPYRKSFSRSAVIGRVRAVAALPESSSVNIANHAARIEASA
jgi:hypothetical protein